MSKIPRWIAVVSGSISVLGLFVGYQLYTSPEMSIPEVDFTRPENTYAAWMWAARQIAIAVVIAVAIVRSSPQMLQITLLAFCVMNVQDALIGMIRNDNGLFIGATFFFILSALMVFLLRKNISSEAQ